MSPSTLASATPPLGPVAASSARIASNYDLSPVQLAAVRQQIEAKKAAAYAKVAVDVPAWHP